ncbi:hypothetical protein [Streptomyces sp. NPDC000656]|uniref:hypothetical protein n=1 Tax=unclassified Streptomyces TaxID=2593676 RepID=UPI0036AA7FB9
MLGSAAEAQDTVRDAWLRWAGRRRRGSWRARCASTGPGGGPPSRRSTASSPCRSAGARSCRWSSRTGWSAGCGAW